MEDESSLTTLEITLIVILSALVFIGLLICLCRSSEDEDDPKAGRRAKIGPKDYNSDMFTENSSNKLHDDSSQLGEFDFQSPAHG